MTHLLAATKACLLPLVIGFGLSACSTDVDNNSRRLLANQANQAGSAVADLRATGVLPNNRGEIHAVGSDEFLGQPPESRLVIPDDEGAFTLNLLRAPIDVAANAVLGDALGWNYAVQPGIQGTVTLQTTRPLSSKLLLETFEKVLQLNGAALRISDDLVQIVPADGGSTRIVRLGDNTAVGARVVAVPLQYIGAAEMVRLLKPITSGSLRFDPIPNRNVLLIGGGREDINAALEAVNLFDLDVMRGKSIGIYRLEAAEPKNVVQELSTILDSFEGGSLEDVVTLLPSDRLNSVIVISTRRAYLTQAETWIKDLDRTAQNVQRRPVVYPLQNRNAADIEPLLTAMMTEASAATGTSQAKIVADTGNNSVVVWADAKEHEMVKRLLTTIDVTPVQVLLEATIAEVTLNDQLDFGLRWFFENGSTSTTFSDVAGGAIAQNFPGFSVLFSRNEAKVALNALNSVTDVNVVSSPSLLVIDNAEARLQIGDQVPIATQQSAETGASTTSIVNTISFRDTGIILSVKPRVSSTGQVTLNIEQEVSSVANTTTSGIDSPTISQRKIETSVVVGDGQTVALGGLIEDTRNRTNSQVPGLGKTPILGGLFRNRSDRVTKTELLVLITPRVIRNGAEARSITNELRDRIEAADGLINTGIAVPDTGHRILR